MSDPLVGSPDWYQLKLRKERRDRIAETIFASWTSRSFHLGALQSVAMESIQAADLLVRVLDANPPKITGGE